MSFYHVCAGLGILSISICRRKQFGVYREIFCGSYICGLLRLNAFRHLVFHLSGKLLLNLHPVENISPFTNISRETLTLVSSVSARSHVVAHIQLGYLRPIRPRKRLFSFL